MCDAQQRVTTQKKCGLRPLLGILELKYLGWINLACSPGTGRGFNPAFATIVAHPQLQTESCRTLIKAQPIKHKQVDLGRDGWFLVLGILTPIAVVMFVMLLLSQIQLNLFSLVGYGRGLSPTALDYQ